MHIKPTVLTMELNELTRASHEAAVASGFWPDGKRNTGEALMLAVSELGEAMEAHRRGARANLAAYDLNAKDEPVDAPFHEDPVEVSNKHLFEYYVKDTLEDELADAVIRIADLCGGLGIDLGRHVRMKMEYNRTRGKLHGKLY